MTKEYESTVRIFIKDKELRKSIVKKIRQIKQDGAAIYAVVPKILDDALTRYIEREKERHIL